MDYTKGAAKPIHSRTEIQKALQQAGISVSKDTISRNIHLKDLYSWSKKDSCECSLERRHSPVFNHTWVDVFRTNSSISVSSDQNVGGLYLYFSTNFKRAFTLVFMNVSTDRVFAYWSPCLLQVLLNFCTGCEWVLLHFSSNLFTSLE